MNIGILIPGFGANEADWALPVYQNLVQELSKTQQVRVIALRYPHTEKPYTYHSTTIYPLGYGAWTRGVHRLSLWWDTFRLVRQLHQEQPFDLLHGIWGDETGALTGWLGSYLGIPSVVTIAGGELIGLPEISYGLQLSRYSRWIVRQALTQNNAIVVPSDLTAQLQAIGYVPPNLHHIPLGINPDSFYPCNHQRKPHHLIHVGSLIPIKNQKLLLDTMRLLDESVTLDIVGEGVLKDELAKYVVQLGLADRVQFRGSIPHTELQQDYSRARLHIMTSHHEAFGMSILESITCGTPTIGTPVGFIADRPDLMLSGNSPQELANHITFLLESEQEWKDYQQRSLQAVKADYTIQQITSQYIALYDTLL